MAELLRGLRSLPQRSIFFKLFLIFLGTALLLILVIRGFFHLALDRNQAFKADLFRNLSKYSRQLVEELGNPPDQERARLLAKELGIQVMVKTPESMWATDPYLPQITDLTVDGTLSNGESKVGQYRRHPFVMIERDETQVILFFLRRPFGDLPTWSFALLVGLVGLILGGGYAVARWLFRPLNWLTAGVGEVAKGHFDYRVPIRSSDEFGRLTESFNEMAKKVREMIRTRDRLLLDVSHELRSPLTRMKLAVEFVQEESTKEKLQQEIRELESMVTELLESERLDSETGGLTRTVTDLIPMVKEIVESYASGDPAVHLVSAPEHIFLPMDHQRVHMAIRNLVENAVKYSRPEYGPVTIQVEQKNDSVFVSVQDHGPGIPQEEHVRIFEPFYRVDPSRNRNTGGYGLGLSLVRKVMVAHGGEVLLQSELDRGSIFTLRFPVQGKSISEEDSRR